MNEDILKLNVSNTFNLANENEVAVDLSLSTPVVNTLGSVTGTVYDTTLLTGNVVPFATVKVFNADGTPYAHTISGADGTYTISDLPLGVYTIAAVKDGNYLSVNVPLTISSTLPVTINLALINNTDATKNVIYGIIDDNITGLPVDNVNVSLYQVVDGTRNLVSTTTTIADGEYTLDKIDAGTYVVTFDKSGYQTSEITNIVLTTSTKFDASTTLTNTVGAINSTVSGTITNELGVIVANAYVGLYKITATGEELVAVTYTNTLGKYMFGNVVEGEYVVKAKLAEVV